MGFTGLIVTGGLHARVGRLIPVLLAVVAIAGASAEEFAHMRENMVDGIARELWRIRSYTGIDTLDANVREALLQTERHEFVPPQQRRFAYENSPLPIGSGQTISQPLVVGLMTQLLGVGAGDRVLELGTGSGYQAAVLAHLVDAVYTVEIVPELAAEARARLNRLGYDNVHVQTGDGTLGWPSEAPFDGIIVTAAGVAVPQQLRAQLRPGGRLVMPVGAEHETQQLMVLTLEPNGEWTERQTIPVRFVPITGNSVP